MYDFLLPLFIIHDEEKPALKLSEDNKGTVQFEPRKQILAV